MEGNYGKLAYDHAFETYNAMAKAVGIREKKYGDIITLNEMEYVFKRHIGYDDSDICEIPDGDLYGYALSKSDKDSD